MITIVLLTCDYESNENWFIGSVFKLLSCIHKNYKCLENLGWFQNCDSSYVFNDFGDLGIILLVFYKPCQMCCEAFISKGKYMNERVPKLG